MDSTAVGEMRARRKSLLNVIVGVHGVETPLSFVSMAFLGCIVVIIPITDFFFQQSLFQKSRLPSWVMFWTSAFLIQSGADTKRYQRDSTVGIVPKERTEYLFVCFMSLQKYHVALVLA